MKTLLVTCLYLYIGLAVYFSFANSLWIPNTNDLAVAFVVGLLLDIFVIDTICAMVNSLFGSEEKHHVVGNVSPMRE